MSVLDSHRSRVAALDDALSRLQSMHEEAWALWNRIVEVSRGALADRREQLDALHDEAYALADRIAQLRGATFGEIEPETQLLLTNTVESVPLAVARRAAAPVPGSPVPSSEAG